MFSSTIQTRTSSYLVATQLHTLSFLHPSSQQTSLSFTTQLWQIIVTEPKNESIYIKTTKNIVILTKMSGKVVITFIYFDQEIWFLFLLRKKQKWFDSKYMKMTLCMSVYFVMFVLRVIIFSHQDCGHNVMIRNPLLPL